MYKSLCCCPEVQAVLEELVPPLMVGQMYIRHYDESGGDKCADERDRHANAKQELGTNRLTCLLVPIDVSSSKHRRMFVQKTAPFNAISIPNPI